MQPWIDILLLAAVISGRSDLGQMMDIYKAMCSSEFNSISLLININILFILAFIHSLTQSVSQSVSQSASQQGRQALIPLPTAPAPVVPPAAVDEEWRNSFFVFIRLFFLFFSF